MKKWKGFFGSVRRSGWRLIALCYAVFLAASVLTALYGAAEDAVRRARGDVTQTDIPGSSEVFALTDLECAVDAGSDGQSAVYTSLSIDPRMELDLMSVSPTGVPAYIRRVTMRVEYLNMEPGELCVFYKPKPDMEEYSAIYRVWAHKEPEEGVYTFTLPMGPMYGLRLDPSIYSGTRFRLVSVTINEPRGVGSRLAPSRPWLLAAAVVPLLTASALRWLFLALDGRGARGRARRRRSPLEEAVEKARRDWEKDH